MVNLILKTLRLLLCFEILGINDLRYCLFQDEKVVVNNNDNMDSRNVAKSSSIEAIDGEFKDQLGAKPYINDNEDDDSIWEDGCVPDSNFTSSYPNDSSTGMEVDISWPEESYKKKPTRRVSPEEKVHIC